jgi:hypothetical protein
MLLNSYFLYNCLKGIWGEELSCKSKRKELLAEPPYKPHTLYQTTLKENYAKNGICVFQNRGVIVGSSSAKTLQAEEQDDGSLC